MSSLNELEDAAPWMRVRYIIVLLRVFAIGQGHLSRSALSLGILAMTDSSINPNFETFDWDPSTKSLILSAFFFGYVPSNLIASVLMQRFGVRWVIIGSSSVNCLFTALTPIFALAMDWPGVVLCRVMQGLSQGPLYPSVTALSVKWDIPTESVMPVIFAGSLIGTAGSLSTGGVLSKGEYGWPSIFYAYTGVSILFTLAWLFFGFDSPSEHYLITKKEKEFIVTQMPSITSKKRRTPWIPILTSLPVLTLVFSNITVFWGFYLILNGMPAFMDKILKFDISKNGFLSAMPYVLMFILTIVLSFVETYLKKRSVSLKIMRRVFTSIGFLGPMFMMIGLCFVGYDERYVAVGLFVVAVGSNAAVNVGFLQNYVELTSNFAGPVMGLGNGLGSAASAVVTLVVGAIVYDEENEELWHTVFGITAGVYFIGASTYVFLSEHEKQPWDEVKNEVEKV